LFSCLFVWVFVWFVCLCVCFVCLFFQHGWTCHELPFSSMHREHRSNADTRAIHECKTTHRTATSSTHHAPPNKPMQTHKLHAQCNAMHNTARLIMQHNAQQCTRTVS
jgi:hypothetical protein